MARKAILDLFSPHSFSCASKRNYDTSNHFNGKKFYNPTLESQFSPSFSDVFKMIRRGRPKWPKEIENTGVSALNKTLGNDEFSITFINHASFLIQTRNLNILIDPVWSKRASPFSWIGPKRVRKPGIELKDLPHIDIVLISHNHYDHLDKAALKTLEKRFSCKTMVPLGDKKLVKSIGIKHVHELDWWQTFEISKHLKITFTPSQHGSGRGLFDRNKSLWGGFYIKLGNRCIYFGGDGGYSYHFKDIAQKLGSPEIAILGIGAYEPGFFMKAIHTRPSEAVQAHLDLGAIQSIGMHFGTFQLASEGFGQPQQDLKIAIEKEDLPESSFITLLEGETKFYRNLKQPYER